MEDGTIGQYILSGLLLLLAGAVIVIGFLKVTEDD
jgi:hypothetical protein